MPQEDLRLIKPELQSQEHGQATQLKFNNVLSATDSVISTTRPGYEIEGSDPVTSTDLKGVSREANVSSSKLLNLAFTDKKQQESVTSDPLESDYVHSSRPPTTKHDFIWNRVDDTIGARDTKVTPATVRRKMIKNEVYKGQEEDWSLNVVDRKSKPRQKTWRELVEHVEPESSEELSNIDQAPQQQEFDKVPKDAQNSLQYIFLGKHNSLIANTDGPGHISEITFIYEHFESPTPTSELENKRLRTNIHAEEIQTSLLDEASYPIIPGSLDNPTRKYDRTDEQYFQNTLGEHESPHSDIVQKPDDQIKDHILHAESLSSSNEVKNTAEVQPSKNAFTYT